MFAIGKGDPKILHDFFSDLETAENSQKDVFKRFLERHGADPDLNEKNFSWIVGKSGLPWLDLDIPFPYKKMNEEAARLTDRFYDHRVYGDHPLSDNRGWKSLVIHGLSPEKTMDSQFYGYPDPRTAPYQWTEIADLCPVTTQFFREKWPATRLHRVRFMMLEPGGYILPHVDRDANMLYETNFALNNPAGIFFKMEGHGYVPFKPGQAYILDVSNNHAVVNLSNEKRIHIIVHGETLRHEGWQTLMERSFKKFLKQARK